MSKKQPSATRRTTKPAKDVAQRPAPTERKKLNRFGKLLKTWRTRAGFKELKEIDPKILKDAGWHSDRPVSVIAQMESGRVSNPDVDNLAAIAKAYRKDPELVSSALTVEKYRLLPEDASVEELEAVATAMAVAAQKQRAGEIGAALLQMPLRDVRGLAQWEMELARQLAPPIELWVVAPNFLDNTNPDIFQAVVSLLAAGASVTYFVKQDDLEGSFARLILNIEDYAQNNKDVMRGRVFGVGLNPDQLCWMAASFAISNPSSATPSPLSSAPAEGFTIIASDGSPAYGIPMSQRDLLSRVGEIRLFLRRYNNGRGPALYFPNQQAAANLETDR